MEGSGTTSLSETGLVVPEVADVSRDLEAVLGPAVPAVAAVVLDIEGTIIAEGAAGQRRRGGEERVTLADRWHLGSMTKAMTATLAAVLVQEGTLAWDTTLEEVFGASFAVDEALRAVTLEQLLANRGGLVGTTSRGSDELLEVFPEVWQRLLERREPLQSERLWFAEQILVVPPRLPPNTATHYSNAGFVIAATMLEQRTGEAFETLLAEYVWQPLGMNEGCGFGPPATPGAVDAPWGHGLVGGRAEPVAPEATFADNPPVLAPAGTVHCSLPAYAHFMALHQGHGTLLTPASLGKLHAPLGNLQPGIGYALGWGRIEHGYGLNGPALWHNGSNTMFVAEVLLADAGHAYVVATNAPLAPGAPVVQTVLTALVQAF